MCIYIGDCLSLVIFLRCLECKSSAWTQDCICNVWCTCLCDRCVHFPKEWSFIGTSCASLFSRKLQRISLYAVPLCRSILKSSDSAVGSSLLLNNVSRTLRSLF
uniref:Hypothetical secreted protein 1875 n=1 Tax=Amblyomma variegatum TaxID=34610 RepID=F0J9Z7_AMBVA|nr:TPA_inf: hypothetical secreted protein 1875 [Amblyomma variegatum]